MTVVRSERFPGWTLPLVGGTLVAVPSGARLVTTAAVALILLAVIGVSGARLGGATPGRAAVRLVVVGGIAMAVAALIGDAVGAVV